MKLYLGLLASVIAATLLRLMVERISPGLMIYAPLRTSIDPLGNLLFVILLGLFVARYSDMILASVRTIVAVAAFIATVVAIVFVAILAEASFGFGLDIVALIGTIGYYPAGADVPIDYGMPLWIASSIPIVVAGLLLGAGLRRFRRTRAPRDDAALT